MTFFGLFGSNPIEKLKDPEVRQRLDQMVEEKTGYLLSANPLPMEARRFYTQEFDPSILRTAPSSIIGDAVMAKGKLGYTHYGNVINLVAFISDSDYYARLGFEVAEFHGRGMTSHSLVPLANLYSSIEDRIHVIDSSDSFLFFDTRGNAVSIPGEEKYAVARIPQELKMGKKSLLLKDVVFANQQTLLGYVYVNDKAYHIKCEGLPDSKKLLNCPML